MLGVQGLLLVAGLVYLILLLLAFENLHFGVRVADAVSIEFDKLRVQLLDVFDLRLHGNQFVVGGACARLVLIQALLDGLVQFLGLQQLLHDFLLFRLGKRGEVLPDHHNNGQQQNFQQFSPFEDGEVWEDLVEEVLFLCVRDDEIDFYQQEHHDDDDDPLGAAPVFPLQRAREYLQQNDEVDGARLQHFLEHVDLGVELVVFVALLQEFVVKVLSR